MGPALKWSTPLCYSKAIYSPVKGVNLTRSQNEEKKSFFYFVDAVPVWDDGCSLGLSWPSFLAYEVNSLCCTPETYPVLYVRYVCVLSCLSHVWLLANLWTVAHQAPLSMEFSRQESWTGLPFPAPGDLPPPGIKPTNPMPPALLADSLLLSYREAQYVHYTSIKMEETNNLFFFTSLSLIYLFQNV